MIARFDLQYQRQPEVVRVRRGGKNVRSGEWLAVGLLTILLVLWMVHRDKLLPTSISGASQFLGELFRLLELAGGSTLIFLWGVLFWRFLRPLDPSISSLNRETLYEMSPTDFEQYVAQLFGHKGYVVKIRGGSGDHGVDLELLKPDGKRAIVQCKRYRSQIGPDIARELYGTLIHERAAHAFLVTTADISRATRAWAQGKPITLIDGHTLLDVATELEIGDQRQT